MSLKISSSGAREILRRTGTAIRDSVTTCTQTASSALDADTGKLNWYFQFVPHDLHDWDATQVPVLVDAEWGGQPRKLVYWAHRGGFYYVLDRETGKFLFGTPFAKQTWAKGLDPAGHPIRLANIDPSPEETYLWPGVQGATNWYAPSYNPLTKLFYVAFWENRSVYRKGEKEYIAGNRLSAANWTSLS